MCLGVTLAAKMGEKNHNTEGTHLFFFSTGVAQADGGLYTVDILALVSSLFALHRHGQ